MLRVIECADPRPLTKSRVPINEPLVRTRRASTWPSRGGFCPAGLWQSWRARISARIQSACLPCRQSPLRIVCRASYSNPDVMIVAGPWLAKPGLDSRGCISVCLSATVISNEEGERVKLKREGLRGGRLGRPGGKIESAALACREQSLAVFD